MFWISDINHLVALGAQSHFEVSTRAEVLCGAWGSALGGETEIAVPYGHGTPIGMNLFNTELPFPARPVFTNAVDSQK